MPSVEHEPDVWLAALEAVGAALRARPVLFPLSDAHCSLVATHAADLRRAFRFIVPDRPVMDTILDKRRQYAAAEQAGVVVPQTFYPERTDEVARLAEALSYPVILKPYTAHLGRPQIGNLKVLVVHTAADLVAMYGMCTASGHPFMVQTIVGGREDGLYWYGGFWDEESRERGCFTVQKLRQFPPGFGDGSLQRTSDAPAVLEESRRLLAALAYRGLVNVEFKLDPAGGRPVLIEINPRPVSGNEIGIRAGVDLAWIAYRHLTAPEPGTTAPPTFRPGVQHVNEEWDVQAFWAQRKAGTLTLIEWLRSLRGTRAWGLFAWDDPRPLLVGVWRAFARTVRSVSARASLRR
jgi:predicted ATP-grasp superfamily ATP-dependent carboligase